LAAAAGVPEAPQAPPGAAGAHAPAANDAAITGRALSPKVDAVDLRSPPADAETVLILIDRADAARAWALQRYVLGSWPFRGLEGLMLVKVLGSGHDGGFVLRPSGTRQGLLCLFETAAQARHFLQDSPIVAEYRANAREFFATRLRAYSCRGSWSGVPVPAVATPPARTEGPIATLTRASIRPRSATAFWKMAPATQAGLEEAPGCRLAVGLGEAPLLRQATFSLWENSDSMERYARSGAHMAAIQAAQQQDFFSESMFVRFRPVEVEGVWKGRRYPESLHAQAGEPPLFDAQASTREMADAAV
jgi:spheroidene monooxygenase